MIWHDRKLAITIAFGQLGLRLERVCGTVQRCNASPRTTDIVQVLNELPTDKRHIKAPEDRLLCNTHADNKKKQVFEKKKFRCVTRPDLSEVPLS